MNLKSPLYACIQRGFFVQVYLKWFCIILIKQEKQSLRTAFPVKGRVFVLFYPKWSAFHWEGVPAADFGDTPQAGSKRGRPFDFSCSIQPKYGQIVNENLRKFENL